MGRTVNMNIGAMLLVLCLLCQSTGTMVSAPTDIHIRKQRTPPKQRHLSTKLYSSMSRVLTATTISNFTV